MRCIPSAVAVLSVLITAVLSGCGGPDTADEAESAARRGAVELNEGGDCDGRDVLINRDGVGVALSGDCGTVTIDANGASVKVDRAEALIVVGQDSNVRGRETGMLTVSGRSNNTSVETIGTAEIRGNAVTVTGSRAERVSVSGSGNTIAIDDVVAADLDGNDNHMTCTGIGTLDVTGSNNSVDWSVGAQRPRTNTGSDNTITGPTE